MSVNRVMISGVIVSQKRMTSPSGIPHCLFSLEHHSQQHEATIIKPVYCRISVVASGDSIIKDSPILVGNHVTVKGYLALQRKRNGQSMIRLHADEIETTH